MLRNRLVTVLTINNGVLFRTKQFSPDYRYTHNFVDAWLVDEIVLLDVTRPEARLGGVTSFEGVVSDVARRCFVPLSAGGGIRSLADARRFMSLGADKVVINSGALQRPELIAEIAEVYGAQCVVVAIDVRQGVAGGEVFADFGRTATGRTAVDWAREAVDRGAGEVMITSIERDGSLRGYDLDLCRSVADAVSVPVLISGGAGAWQHFVEGVVQGGASAVCTTNIYHFTESSVKSAKAFMDKAGIPVRLS